MQAQKLIENYVDDVAARLPRRMRNDVGLELRALLGDHLKAVAAESGREPDASMALKLLRRFGSPAEVASTYEPRGFHLIEPEHAPLFVKLAILCGGVQWALTLPAVFNGTTTFSAWWLGWGLGVFWWPGMLIAYFAGAAWIRRASPVDPDTGKRPWTHWILWLPMTEEWRPRTAHTAGPVATKIQITLATLVTLIFAAPWFVALFTSYAFWARYDSGFARWLFVPVIALLAARIVLFAAVAADARRREPTEALRGALWIASVGVLYWVALGWNLFANAAVDAVFKGWLMFFLLVNTLQITGWIRREFVRVRVRLPQSRGSTV